MRRTILAVAAAMAVGGTGAEKATAASDAVSRATDAAGTNRVEAKGFVLEYRIEGAHLVATLSYKTTGWISVGFNPVKKMQGADIIIGYAGADGNSVVDDHYGVSPIAHKPDTAVGGRNNIVEGRCQEKDGVTTMWFTIPLASGDSKDSRIEPGSEVRVIFAAGKKDDMRSKHSAVAGAIMKL